MDSVLPEDREHAARRDRSIRLAVVTSFLSKAGTALLQLLSIPIAVRALGREEFGIYSTVNVTLGFVSLLQVGIGPALAHGLSRARAEGDETRIRQLCSSAFFLMAAVAVVAGLGLAGVLATVPLPGLFGAEFAGREALLRPALWTGCGLFLMLFVLSLTERVREGLLESSTNNLWGAAGNLLAALAVGVGMQVMPAVWLLVLAVHGSQVVAKLGNTCALWRRAETRPVFSGFRLATVRHLVSDGFAWAACTLVASFVEFSFCGWLVGRTDGPAEVALYGVFTSLTILQLGFVMMITNPTWPAIADALTRGDEDWARRAVRRLRCYGALFGAAAVGGLILLGPWALGLWLGKDFGGVSRAGMAAYAVYFFAYLWRHLQHTVLQGAGRIRLMARLQWLESTLIAATAWPALHWGGLPGLLLVNAAIILVLSGVVLGRLSRI